MIHDLLRALAVAGMMRLACVGLAGSSGLAVAILCWSIPLVLGAVAFVSLRLVCRIQQHEHAMPQRGTRWGRGVADDA